MPHSPAPEFVQYLVQKSAALEATDCNGWTPLHVAIACGNYTTALRLVEHGSSVEARDSLGRTPMHVLGIDSLARQRYPRYHLPYAVRLTAFGPSAPLMTRSEHILRVGDEDESPCHSDSTLDNDSAISLVDAFLHRGFDFCSLDSDGNMPFSFTSNCSVHYLMIHAAACQGLLG